jgi:hypothetical protein
MKLLFSLVLICVLSQSWGDECEANLAKSVRERNDFEQRVKELQGFNSELLKLTQEAQAALETANQKLQTTENEGCQKKTVPKLEGLREIGIWSKLIW